MKKKIKLLIIFLLAIVFIICLNGKVNAAMEIKDGTGVGVCSTSITNAYQMCYDLRNPTSTLSKNSLDPHLTLNADWAAATYLGLSGYGGATGNESTYTTGNNSGVRTWAGYSASQQNFWTSGIYESSSGGEYIANLYKNKNTKYVEILKLGSTQNKGLGFDEVKSIVGNSAGLGYNNHVVSMKTKYLKSNSAANSINYTANPRPVIWN